MILRLVLLLLLLGQDKDAGSVRIVTTGEVLKIDASKKTFQFRIPLDSFPRVMRRGGRGRGGNFPPGPPPGPRDVQYVPVIEVKVFAIDVTGLRVGDRISIVGIHKGKGNDIQALEIAR